VPVLGFIILAGTGQFFKVICAPETVFADQENTQMIIVGL
jgi:hypothetical protein